MQDKSFYSSNNQSQSISEALQNYINQLAEEIVLKREDFATNRKWLKKYIEMENISFEAYEKDFLDLLQLIDDYRQTQSSAILRMMNSLACNCYISNELLQSLINRKVQRHSFEPEMVKVQGGTFTMGCTSEQGDDCDSDEKPAHSVTVSSFQIGKYEVTQAQWKAIMGTTLRQQRDKANPKMGLYGEGDNYPMYYVSWDDAQEFIRRLNTATGKNYRLPTEAEWEYAARGGNLSKGYKYSGSNDIDEVAWYKSNSGFLIHFQTHPAGTKKANELGIHDMSGNVWEWCQDWYGEYFASSQTNPKGASNGYKRVNRGGNWCYSAVHCRVASRNYDSPGYRAINLGFRVVLP